MIEHKELLRRLSYDPETGIFRWKIRPRQRACSEIAGTVNECGYRQICVGRMTYKAHRLAWFYVHGVWPSGQIDHKNGQRHDNRIENLREACFSQNQANSKPRASQSGRKGVYFNRHVGFWYARITVNYRRIHLGCFKTREEAAAAYAQAADKYFGEFARAA